VLSKRSGLSSEWLSDPKALQFGPQSKRQGLALEMGKIGHPQQIFCDLASQLEALLRKMSNSHQLRYRARSMSYSHLQLAYLE
jgi:hypothetical protein